MPKTGSTYTTVISLIGVALIGWGLTHLPPQWIEVLAFLGLAAVAEWTNVELFPSSRSRVSLSSAVALAAMLQFGPMGGVLTHAASGLATALTTTLQSNREKSGRASILRRSAFNIGMFVISIAAAGFVYTAAGGTVGQIALVGNILPLILAVVSDHVVNVGLLVGVISLQTGRRPIAIWREEFFWAMPIAVLGAGLSSAALTYGYELARLLGLAVFLLPVLLIRWSYSLYVVRTKKMRMLLKNTGSELKATLDAIIRSQKANAAVASAASGKEPSLVHQVKRIDEDLGAEVDRLTVLLAEISQPES